MLETIKREIFRRNIRSREEFDTYGETVMRSLFEKSHALREAVFKILDAYGEARRAIREAEQAAGASRVAAALSREVKAELETLVPSDFLDVYPLERLVHLPRYLEALCIRLNRGKVDYDKDRRKAEQLRPFIEALERIKEEMTAEAPSGKRKAMEELRWMVEEFKVALFAPELKTAFPISPKRLAIKIHEVEALGEPERLTGRGKTL
jgi:ATP-dependent helicase HrpA